MGSSTLVDLLRLNTPPLYSFLDSKVAIIEDLEAIGGRVSYFSASLLDSKSLRKMLCSSDVRKSLCFVFERGRFGLFGVLL